MGFVDDLEFWADPIDGVIHVHSASRLGRKDFGVNRARIGRYGRRWTKRPEPPQPLPKALSRHSSKPSAKVWRARSANSAARP